MSWFSLVFSMLWFGPFQTDLVEVSQANKSGDPTCLLLRDGRFEARVEWRDSRSSDMRQGEAVSLRDETGFDETGYFFFEDPNNVDVIVRVFDGCDFNDNFWVFAGGLTKVDYTLSVTDTLTGAIKQYSNPLGVSSPPIQDTQAFATCPAPVLSKKAKAPGSELLSLHGGRFKVEIDYDIPDNQAGKGTVGLETETSGAFWFLDQSDFNVYLKITDARAQNGHYHLTYTSFTGAPYVMTVTDTVTGRAKTYENKLNQTSYGTDLFLTGEEDTQLLFPWVSDNTNFDSVLNINNNNCMGAEVTLEALRGDGASQSVTRSIPPSGFLEEAATDMFPELSGGSGYTVLLKSGTTGLSGRWVTNNKNTPSGASPSQGVAVHIPKEVAKPVAPNARVGQALQFGLLPLQPDFFAGTVVVNVGDAATDVTLYFYDRNGRVIDVDEESGKDLQPFQPFAAVSRNLVPDRTDNVAMVAYSKDQPLTGVTFIFNQDGEPSIGNATAFDFVPPLK